MSLNLPKEGVVKKKTSQRLLLKYILPMENPCSDHLGNFRVAENYTLYVFPFVKKSCGLVFSDA